MTASYQYGADGIRLSKTVDGETTRFLTAGNHVLAEQKGSGSWQHYFYDASGQLTAITYKGADYYYVRDGLMNITGLVDSNGATMVEYSYDSWGRIKVVSGSMKDTLGADNPYRYKGYYYDVETGLYYLGSRYYDVQTYRFINADYIVGMAENFNAYNLFSYCFNNAIVLMDPEGTCPYSGSAADFHRLEQGKPPLNCNCVDLTGKLDACMVENEKRLKDYWKKNGYVKTAFYFRNNVDDGKELDLKSKAEWKFEDGKKYYYRGMELRYDDPGNINFGYVGAVIFPEIVLCAGAGANQMLKFGFEFGNPLTFFDDPRDNAMVKYGFRLYKESH